MSFRVVPISDELAETARRELRSPQYGHPAHVETASGYGPCRSCLHTFTVGAEQRLLMTYNPFDGLNSYPSPGPIYIHPERCEPFAGNGFPADLRALPLYLEGYDDDRMVVERVPATGDDVESGIARVFQNDRVRYIHVRNAEAGCFIARVEKTF
jgi:hypothetical protein